MKYLLASAALAFGLCAGAANAEGWNSIALDMAGGYNLVLGAESEEAARQEALDACGSESCQSVFSTEAQCFAIADTPEGNYNYGWAVGATREGVEMIAMGYCIESSYPGCKPLVAQCATEGATPVDEPGPGPKVKTKG